MAISADDPLRAGIVDDAAVVDFAIGALSDTLPEEEKF